MSPNYKSLKIAVRKFSPFENALEKIWQSFKTETGCMFELEFCPMDLSELHQSLFEENGLINGKWDIVHMSSDWIAEAYNTKTVENLSPFIHQKEEKDYLKNWTSSLLKSQTFENNIYGLPFHDGPECLVYRKDLFELEENKTKFKTQFGKELTVPKTWEVYLQTASFFSSLNKDFYGSAIAAFPDGHNAVYGFCIQAWSRGGEFLKADNSININIPQIVEGLNYYRGSIQSHNINHPQSKEFDSVRMGQAFANGEIAMMLNWFGFAAYAQVDGSSKVKDKIGVTNIPTDGNNDPVSPNSYWMYSIANGSQNKDLAYDFISFATNQNNDCLLTLEGGIGCRYTTYNNTHVNKFIPFFNKLEALHLNAKDLPNIPHWAQVAEIIDNVMQKTMNTDEPIENILREAQLNIYQTLSHYADN